ncbi:extensin family protein [Microvirga sp. GCM10011540]|uniref:extensin-like domain-containing protein n=1 Tax=Microvirga sp. GCM10011540 TaxID=3317338 RepID=UPI0036062831
MSEERPSPPRRSRLLPVIVGRLLIVALAGLALVSGLVWTGAIVVPDRFNPFAPLRIADAPNWLTRMKLSRLEDKVGQCLAVIENSPLHFSPVPDQVLGEGCGFANAVEVARSTVDFSRSFTATCPLAAAWALLETHVLQDAARQHLGQEVASVIHFGTYACRNINHRASGRRSEHAMANAIDIAGFVLADGRKITLLDDWSGSDPREAAFLRAVRDGACRFFDVVLSPDYNEAHRDHFHFDMGPYDTCR